MTMVGRRKPSGVKDRTLPYAVTPSNMGARAPTGKGRPCAGSAGISARALLIMRGSYRPRHSDGRRFVHGQESFDQRRATQERYPFLAQGAQQFDPAGIRKRQTLQIETYSVGGSGRRNDLSCLLDPCTE